MSRALVRYSDRLVAREILVALLLVWLVFVGFDAINALVEELQDVGKGSYTLVDALQYTLLTVPRRMYELFPRAAVIGCMLGLGALASSSELTALRAGGLSKLRICAGGIAAVGLLTVLMALAGETVAPWGELRAQAFALRQRSGDLALAGGAELWAREGDTFLNAKHGGLHADGAEGYVELSGVRLYEFDREGRLQSLATAARAQHRDGRWKLFDVKRSRFHDRRVETTHVESEAWTSGLDPEVLSLSLKRPRYMSTAQLSENLQYLRSNGLDAGQFEVAYWTRLFYPLNTLVLCLAAMPFAFGALRSGGFGKRLFIGIVLVLGFMVVQRLALDVASVYRVDLRLANLLPPLVVAVLAIAYFRRRA